jgi:hypothetical protein
MKTFNLSVLIAVLFLASAANALVVRLSTDGAVAADELNAVPGGSYTVYVISDSDHVNYWTYLEMDLPSPGTVAGGDPENNITIYSAAGNIASVADYSSVSILDVELAANDSGGNVAAGIHFSFTLDVSSEWDETPFDIWITKPKDETFPVEHTLTVVPEPMTLALLGLGGLLLRRKK